MFSQSMTRSVMLACLCGFIIACGRSPEPTATASPAAGSTVNIAFKVDPDPPRAGDNKLEVSVKQAGASVIDATVTAVFYMPAMPAMNMPEMRSTFSLHPSGDGVYRGTGTLIMAGTWNVTVNVSRAGDKLGSSKYTVIAR
jgi:YtkA-like